MPACFEGRLLCGSVARLQLGDKRSGLAINEVNLTQWKQGGFLEWQNLEQKRDWLTQLLDSPDPVSGGPRWGAVASAPVAASR